MEISIGFSPILVHRFESLSELIGSCEPSSELVVLQRLRENQTISWMDRGLPPEKKHCCGKSWRNGIPLCLATMVTASKGPGRGKGWTGKSQKLRAAHTNHCAHSRSPSTTDQITLLEEIRSYRLLVYGSHDRAHERLCREITRSSLSSYRGQVEFSTRPIVHNSQNLQ